MELRRILIFNLIIWWLFPSLLMAASLSPQQLIEQKMNELRQIQSQRENVEKNINELNKTKGSLSKELKIVNANINQLNLAVKGNEIVLEKLGLEINYINEDIGNIKEKIKIDENLMAKFLIELQEKDHENLLVLFLKNRSLAASVSEVQNFVSLNSRLSEEIKQSKQDREILNQKSDELKDKKDQKNLERANLVDRQLIIQDQKNEKQNLLAVTKNQEKIYQQQLQDLIQKQEAIADEIEKIELELRKHIDPNLLPAPRPGILALPTQGIISQDYGYTAFARYGYRGHFHKGIDIAAPLGTPIFAAESGTVIALGDQDRYCYRGAYGKFIVIKHENNLTTLYAHLSRQAVRVGDKIKRGDLIGYVGRSGYATGSHLHLTVYAGPTFYMGSSRTCGPMPFGGDLNPISYLDIKN